MKALYFLSIATAASLISQGIADDENKSKPTGSQQQTSQQKDSQNQSSQNASSSKGSPGTKVTLNELPDKVQKTFRSEAGNVNMDSLNKLSKNGQSVYVGTFDKNGMKGQIVVDQDGSLLQAVQTGNIALVSQAPALGKSDLKQSELPNPVQSALKEHAGTNQLGAISEIEHGGQTLYTAAYNDAGVQTQLLFDKEGYLVLRAEETALMAAPLVSAQTVTMQTAPKQVQDAIRQHAGANAQVSDIDKGQWNGQTAYRVLVQKKNGTSRPVLISESGEILRGSQPSSVGSAGTSQQGRSQQSQQSNSKSSSTEASSSDQK
jgi:hypothetical protein